MASILLRDVVNEMAEIGDNHHAFLDLETGEITSMNDKQRALVEDGVGDTPLEDWQLRFRNRLRSGEIVELPGKFEHKEYSVVESFCETIREKKQRDKLLKAIRGKRAFRDFNRLIGKYGLTERWKGFRVRAFEQLAIAWLDEHDIAYDKAA